MENTLDLTFAIVAYNNYDQIINAVKTINRFTTDYTKEIIVADNTERKNIKNLSSEFDKLKKMPSVRIINNKKNVGFGKANNIALKNARGKYFVICNPDILMIEESFNKIIPYLENNQSVGAVIPKLLDKNKNLEPVYRRELTLFDVVIRYIHPFGTFKKRRAYHVMKDKDFNHVFKVPFAQGSFIVIRTNLMKKLHGFDEQYFMYVEDADLCKKINKVSTLVYFPYTAVIHLWNKGSHRNPTLLKWHIESMFKYFKKWGIR